MKFFCKLIWEVAGKTIAIDGKTICSTANKGNFKSPLHIVSAFVVENGITIGQLVACKHGEALAPPSLLGRPPQAPARTRRVRLVR